MFASKHLRYDLFNWPTGNPEAELAAFARFALNIQSAAQRLSECCANRQPESIAFARTFGAEEWIENPGEQVRGYSLASVLHFDYGPRTLAACRDNDLALFVAECVDCIAEKIVKNLIDHRCIGGDFADCFIDSDLELSVCFSSLQGRPSTLLRDCAQVAQGQLGLPLTC